MDDECSKAMKSCDPKGPVMMLVTRIIPKEQYGFYTFGRIFSGRIEQDVKIRILGPNYIPGKHNDLFIKKVRRVLIIKERKIEDIFEAPCGNICALECLNKLLLSQMTLTSSSDAHIIKSKKYLKPPIIGTSINPKNVTDLPKLI